MLAEFLPDLPTGEKGGRSVLSGRTSSEVASRYIRDFMRPGKDTASGTARALRYLGGGAVVVGGGASGVSPEEFNANTDKIVGLRDANFVMQEALKSQGLVNAQDTAGVNADRRQQALRTGDPEVLRQLELELKIEEAIADNAPEWADRIRVAMTGADLAERRLKAEERIQELTRATGDQERRNAALATGSGIEQRNLELQLRVEQIRRSGAPPAEQKREIDAATKQDDAQRAEAAARMLGSLEQQKRAMQDQWELLRYHGDELRVQQRVRQAIQALIDAGVPPESERGRLILAQTEALERQIVVLEKAQQDAADWRNIWKGAAEGVGRAISVSFSTAFREGKGAAKAGLDAIESMFYDMLDRIIEKRSSMAFETTPDTSLVFFPDVLQLDQCIDFDRRRPYPRRHPSLRR